jgi:Zn-dependent peptidase ImmA (M78 family)
MNERREPGAREPGSRESARRSRERWGPAYARALLAELPAKLGGVREIAAALELDLREVEADGFEGALIRARNLPLGAIVVRDSIREDGRKNFTIAHEIGHFVLPGHDRASLACTASEVANWTEAAPEKELEREADEFAAELLMPASLVETIIKNFPPSLEIIEQIARASGASLSAAAWRYCDLAREKCAVVWSTEGAIQWAKRAAGFPFFLPKGQRVQEGSFAAACFEGSKVPGRPRVVPARLWIGAATLHSSLRLLEQSKALPSYRSAISLLWIEDHQPGHADE